MGERNGDFIEDKTASETGSVLLWIALPAKGQRSTAQKLYQEPWWKYQLSNYLE